ncbi:hypothetical protein [Rhizobium leguminosarum]|uniref:hypothetical protein n=1 Tax=Rhizobium leguminosarum TaxID=384 RepID=UPI001C938E61|nr:hypothetical protein [Rhizobium leguminosarum]MBY5371683.1 hypothetical protein [Rhizobium leguminosarum]
MNELFAAIARPGALERIKEHVSYLQSVSSTIKEFRTSFAIAFDANAALRRSSRRQVATELDSVLHMLSKTHPTPDPKTLWDQKFRKTKWNSWARLQAVSSGLEIIGSMVLSVIDARVSAPSPIGRSSSANCDQIDHIDPVIANRGYARGQIAIDNTVTADRKLSEVDNPLDCWLGPSKRQPKPTL